MKLSEYIELLQDVLDKHGELECWYSKDDESNGFQTVNYTPSTLYRLKEQDKRGDLTTKDEIDDEEYDIDDYVKVVCVN